MTNKILYLDMDGVLANFHKAICQATNVPYPSQTLLGFDWYIRTYGGTVSSFCLLMEQCPDIWRDAELYPWVPEMIEFINQYAPNWNILTTAQPAPVSWSGKAEWVAKHFTKKSLSRLIIVAGRKERLARPGAILVDDHKINCDAWERSGGTAFQWLEYSDDHIEIPNQLQKLKDFIKKEFPIAPQV